MSGHFKAEADKYLADHGLQSDYMAQKNTYDMSVFCTDLIVPAQTAKRQNGVGTGGYDR
jgi:hypothetical protein